MSGSKVMGSIAVMTSERPGCVDSVHYYYYLYFPFPSTPQKMNLIFIVADDGGSDCVHMKIFKALDNVKIPLHVKSDAMGSFADFCTPQVSELLMTNAPLVF